jgi:hypothetical protein
MNTLTTYESLSNYISKVNQWLLFAYKKIELLENKTNKINLLAKSKCDFVNFFRNLRFPKPIVEGFRTKSTNSLYNFFICDDEINLKLYENLLTTLQLEYSIICILHCPNICQTPEIKDFFSKSLLILNDVKEINKNLKDLDYSLEHLLIV